MNETLDQLQEIFRQVFDDEELTLHDQMTAKDFDGWDSMMTINFMIAIEKRFKIKFATAEIAGIKAEGQNIGMLISLIEKKAHHAP